MNGCVPQFLLPLSGIMEVAEGETIVLEVGVHGRPLPDVEWFLNGREIKGHSQSNRGPNFEHRNELRIHPATQLGILKLS